MTPIAPSDPASGDPDTDSAGRAVNGASNDVEQIASRAGSDEGEGGKGGKGGKSGASCEEPAELPALPAVKTWLVDGYNVLHTVLLGGRDRSEWWREEARQEVIDRVAELVDESAEIVVVFDGSRPTDESEPQSRPTVVFASSADDWLVSTVRGAERPEQIGVVTADRKVAGRCRHKGASVVSPRNFLAHCPAGNPGEAGEPDR